MKTGEEKLDVFHRRLLRRVIGVLRPEKFTNDNLYCKISQKNVALQKKQKTHFTSTYNETESKLACANIKDAHLHAPIKPMRGRPKTIIFFVLQKDLKALNIDSNNLEDSLNNNCY